MGKARGEANIIVLETNSISDHGTTSTSLSQPTSLPQELTPPSPPRSFTPSAQTTHSQPPPPYVTSQTNFPSYRNLSNTTNHPRTHSHLPWHSTSFRLRLPVTFFALLSTILFLISLQHADSVYVDGLNYFVDASGLGIMAYSLLTSLCLLITQIILFIQKKDKMHPAIPLVFDLLAWGALLSMAIIFATQGYPVGYRIYDGGSGFNSTAAEGIAVVSVWINAVLHFVIFVRACKAVHRKRKEIKVMKATLRAYVEMG